MHFLWMIIIGAIVGVLAKLIMPGRDPGGVIITIALGIAGALIAGMFGRAVGWYSQPDQSAGLIASVIGAVVLLGLYRVITGRRVAAG